jgi:hypothetical protein
MKIPVADGFRDRRSGATTLSVSLSPALLVGSSAPTRQKLVRRLRKSCQCLVLFYVNKATY